MLSSYTELDKVVDEFVLDVINKLMSLGMSYNEITDIFKEKGYWDLLNDTEVAIVGVHYGVDSFVERVKNEL